MIKPIFKNKFKIPEWAREIVFSLFVFSLTLLSSSVPFAFGTYPFALSICASSKKQAPFAFFGALFGTIFFLDSSPVYLIGYLALFVLRLLASFFKKPKEKPLLGKRNVSFLDELFYESAILRVLSAFSVALGEQKGSLECGDYNNALSKCVSLFEMSKNLHNVLDFNIEDII